MLLEMTGERVQRLVDLCGPRRSGRLHPYLRQEPPPERRVVEQAVDVDARDVVLKEAERVTQKWLNVGRRMCPAVVDLVACEGLASRQERHGSLARNFAGGEDSLYVQQAQTRQATRRTFDRLRVVDNAPEHL